jgi:hypothetical protein
MEAVPMRVSAMHFCFKDSPKIRLLKAVATLMVGGKTRTRLTFHSGDTAWDVRYRLMGFGVPVDMLPVTETGKLKPRPWLTWIKLQKWLENNQKVQHSHQFLDQEPDTPVIQCPFSKDVVFRNGTSSMSNPGNVMFRGLVEASYLQHHHARTNDEKMAISLEIMETIEAQGGRFLEWHKEGKGSNVLGWWQVMDDRKVVRAKIAICLRDFKKLAQARNNVQTVPCSTFAFERQDGRKRQRMIIEGGGGDSARQSQECACFF